MSTIYFKAIEKGLGHNIKTMQYSKEVPVGSSKPQFYSNCSLDIPSFDCKSYTIKHCKTAVVKKITTETNHEFIDSVLAGSLLNKGEL